MHQKPRLPTAHTSGPYDCDRIMGDSGKEDNMQSFHTDKQQLLALKGIAVSTLLVGIAVSTLLVDTQQEINENELTEFNTQDGQDTDESNAATSSSLHFERRQRHRLRPLQQSDSEETQNVNVPEMQNVETPASSIPMQSRRNRLVQFYRRRSHASQRERAVEESITGSVVDDKILKIQRLQSKDIRVMKEKIGRIDKEIGAMHNSIKHMTNVIDKGHRATSQNLLRIATSLAKMCTVIQTQQGESQKRHLRAMTCMQGHTKGMSRLSSSTAQLCKQTVAMQHDLKHICGEIARGMGALHNLVQKTQSHDAPGNQSEIGVSDVASNVSGILVPELPEARNSNRKK
ncbi:uncharacterized protein LOC144818585 isoform X2 [Lissotriton helveticus]